MTNKLLAWTRNIKFAIRKLTPALFAMTLFLGMLFIGNSTAQNCIKDTNGAYLCF